MKQKTKYGLIFITFAFLTIPVYFNVFIEFFFITDLSLQIITLLIIGLILLILFGKLIEMYGYNSDISKIMQKHDIVNSLIQDNNKIIRWLGFLLTMTFEEFLFRYYLIGLLINPLQLSSILAVLISSAIFSLYHIHTWFAYKNIRIFTLYLIYSFLLGLYNGYLLLTLGIIPCIFIHYVLAYLLYYNIYKRYFE